MARRQQQRRLTDSYDLIAMIWHDMQYVYIYITVLVHRVALHQNNNYPHLPPLPVICPSLPDG